MAIREYLRPATVDQALTWLNQEAGRARIVGGGTDLALHPAPETTTLIDLARTGLGEISAADGTITIGATATLTAVAEHPAIAAHLGGVIPAMLRHVGSPLLRNAATVGGHLARGRLSDVIPLFVALDASVSYFDGSGQETSLEDYYGAGIQHTRHILTAVHLPPPPDDGDAEFLRFSRTAFDVAMLNGACVVGWDDDRVERARVAIGERPGRGTRIRAAEAVLEGEPLDEARIARCAQTAQEMVDVDGDSRASARYRRHLTSITVRRCLAAIATRRGDGR